MNTTDKVDIHFVNIPQSKIQTTLSYIHHFMKHYPTRMGGITSGVLYGDPDQSIVVYRTPGGKIVARGSTG